MTEKAAQAIYAAKHKHIWGRYATLGYVRNHNIPLSAYRLVCQLNAMKQSNEC